MGDLTYHIIQTVDMIVYAFSIFETNFFLIGEMLNSFNDVDHGSHKLIKFIFSYVVGCFIRYVL